MSQEIFDPEAREDSCISFGHSENGKMVVDFTMTKEEYDEYRQLNEPRVCDNRLAEAMIHKAMKDGDDWEVVPNRKMRRKAKHKRRKLKTKTEVVGPSE